MEKTSGIIEGDEVGLFPCLWIGLMDKSTELVDISSLENGKFLFEHQYQGTATEQVRLFGIIMPLSTCENEAILQKLRSMEKKYFENPFISWVPNLDELVQVRNELKEIGPLDCTFEFRFIGEAFITFSLNEETFKWIKQNFKMVIKIQDTDDYTPVICTELDKIRWNSLSELSNWFSSKEKPIYKQWLKGAFIYENSD